MSYRDDRLLLRQIEEALTQAALLATEVGTDAPAPRQELLELGLGHLLKRIATLAGRLSPATRLRHPEVPWTELAALGGEVDPEAQRIAAGKARALVSTRFSVLAALLAAALAREPEPDPPPPVFSRTLSDVLQRLGLAPDRLAQFCRQRGIRRLALFGSVLRQDFGPDSDVDVLVEFEAGAAPRGLAFFGVQEDLAQLLGRPVDLYTEGDLRPELLERVQADAAAVYAAA